MATITIRISTTIVTYQWQMKGSRGSPLVHRPVILSGSQAEGVKKKEALEEVSLITSHGYECVHNDYVFLKQNALWK